MQHHSHKSAHSRALVVPLLVLAAAGVMIGLGFWQWGRHQQRQVLNARIVAQLALPPLPFAAALQTPDNATGRQVFVRGRFDYVNEIVLRNQARNGVPGAHILTPLRLDDGIGVLVDRGWVPLADAEQGSRQRFHVPHNGAIELTGILREPQLPNGPLAPRDVIPPGQTRLDAWFRVNTAAIAQQLPYPLHAVWIVQTDPTAADALPWRAAPQPPDAGPHLSYALQWWGFAAVLVVGYGVGRGASKGR